MTIRFSHLPALEELLNSVDPEQRSVLAESERLHCLSTLASLLEEPEDEVIHKVAQLSGLEFLEQWEPSSVPSQHLPLRLINEYQCFPLLETDEDPNALRLITVWPPDEVMNDWVYAATGKHAQWYLGDPAKIHQIITQRFGVGSGTLDESKLDIIEEEEAEEDDENAAIIRFVNEVIAKAVTDRATDIHFEPQKDHLQIRYRIDGALVPISVPDNLVRFQGAIISRIKIMSRLNISERRRPQDGRIAFGQGDGALDIRISTLPTLYGESISMRLLQQSKEPLSIKDLGFLEKDEQDIEHQLLRPHGILLVTGPTGSGKSTTLTAFIRKIATPERRVITVEDPVEYEVAGVNQTQVHHEIGLDFASALRTCLRQDPDVIMVGEIRDRETADIAIRASLTGHLVLSTLHTNDAPGAITRLIDMEIEPFLIASSVGMVIAQRLVRRLCSNCKKTAKFEPGYLETCLRALRLPEKEIQNEHLAQEPQLCDSCRRIGYKGRVGIFEIMHVTGEMHKLIVDQESAGVIRKLALSQRMQTLQSSGWEQVKRGLTSLSEIMRYSETVGDDD